MKKIVLCSLFSTLFLSACSGDVKESLGLKKTAPDEFAVAKKPKLEVPPEFKLRPPEPDARPLNDKEVRDQAREVLIGKQTPVANKTAGESNLLQKTGAAAVDPKIRQTINEEYGVEDPTTLEKIRSISDKNAANTVVDPNAERHRISENKKDGKPVTEGEVKTKPASGGSFIERILGN